MYILNTMHFHVITLFPEMFDSYLNESILARARKEKKIKVTFINPRKFVTGKYRKVWPDGNVSLQVDDRPYGGGPGMVMRAEPVVKAIESVIKKIKDKRKIKIIFFSPAGKLFDTLYSKQVVKKYTDIIFISGRYEGIDARVKKIFKCDDISIGNYVLTGGELPAMVLIDSISRQVKGVLGKFESLEEERISSSEIYTRPEVFEYKGKKYAAPKVLLSGDPKKIEEWKQGNSS
jgi:tRNA (guanine37-N1)-methyltransferase